MKFIYSFLVLFSIVLLIMGSSTSSARKDVGEYWKSVMKGQAMPESIRDLLHDDQDPLIIPSDPTINGTPMKRDLFVKDFDVRRSAIIYHSGHDSQQLRREGQGDHNKTTHG